MGDVESKKEIAKVILDTNFLIYCAKEKIDYESEISDLLNEPYELVVPLQVIEELKKLKDDKLKKVSWKDRTACDLALQLIEVKKIKKIKAEGKTVDEAIINLSNTNPKNIVATMDREMRFALRRVILISRKKRFLLKE